VSPESPTRLNAVLRLVAAWDSDPELLNDFERFRKVSGLPTPDDG
jgi:hypothetical protein